MHNLYAIFVKYLDISKQIAGNLVNKQGNVPQHSVVPRFSDLEIVALSIDSKPIEVCRLSRAKRCSIGKKDTEKAPSFGYCASQGSYYTMGISYMPSVD